MDYFKRIQDTVEFIEDHLQGELRIEDIAAKSFFSVFHFQRLFRAMSGFSVYEYIRKRRLSEAAALLRESDKTILEIAVTYQYGSHEAFTRAFMNCYQVSPGRYRKSGMPIVRRSKINFLERSDEGEIIMQINKPEIIHLTPIKIIGVAYKFREGDDPFDVCHGFYRDFGEHEYFTRIPGRAHPAISYGISNGDSFIVGEEVENIDTPIEDGFIRFEIPAGKYAVFSVIDSVTAVQETIKYIYRTWLPNANYALRQAPYFEVTDVCDCIYPDRMNMKIYIPIE
jgi:AraC family transcriptional regulator